MSTEDGMRLTHNDNAKITFDLCPYNMYIIKVLYKYKR